MAALPLGAGRRLALCYNLHRGRTLRAWHVATRISLRNSDASLTEPMVAEGEGEGPNSASDRTRSSHHLTKHVLAHGFGVEKLEN
jgi:hypothetical protein